MRWLLLTFLVTGCTGELLARLEQDIAVLRERIQAREEVRIQVAGPVPATKTGNVASNEPHVAVGCPEQATIVRYVQREKSREKSRRIKRKK